MAAACFVTMWGGKSVQYLLNVLCLHRQAYFNHLYIDCVFATVILGVPTCSCLCAACNANKSGKLNDFYRTQAHSMMETEEFCQELPANNRVWSWSAGFRSAVDAALLPLYNASIEVFLAYLQQYSLLCDVLFHIL